MMPRGAISITLFFMLLCSGVLQEHASASQFHVSPTGSPNGTGSKTKPWDLQTALDNPSNVLTGDTIWVHGGKYIGAFTSSLTGASNRPIVVRNYNNERAIIDGMSNGVALTIGGGYTWFWGLEVTNSLGNPDPLDDIPGIANGTAAAGIKVINCITHDNTGNGISAFSGWTNTEIYGCLSYYNGRTPNAGPNYAYGLYSQNQAPSTKEIRDNFFIHNYGNYPLHIYGSENAFLDNYRIVGNVCYGNPDGGSWFLIGGGNIVQNPVIDSNYFYGAGDITDGIADIGYSLGNGTNNAAVRGNYFMRGATWISKGHPGLVMTGNTLWGPISGFTQGQFPNNTFTSATGRPTGLWTFVRPNKYEPGRANIIVYNWNGNSSASVDVTGVLKIGDQYDVVDAGNYFGTPVASGTYAGGLISIPLTNTKLAIPVSVPSGRPTPVHASSEYGMFILKAAHAQGTFGAIPDTLPIGGGTVTLTWTSQNATSASIDQGVGPVVLNGTTTVLVTTTKIFTLTLTNSAGSTTYSADVFVPPLPAPSPVLPVSGAINQPTAALLSWDASPGATSYHLQVSLDPAFGALVFNDSTITQTSRQVGSLLNNTMYYWQVRAKNGSQASAFSPVSSFTTIVAPPAAPILTAPANGALNQVTTLTLRWNALSGASNYRAQLSNDSVFGVLVVDDSAIVGTSRRVAGLDTSKKYFWRVKAKNIGGTGPYSATSSFTTRNTTAVEDPIDGIPRELVLEQNYPNPFNPSTRIVFRLPNASQVLLTVYDLLGQEVAQLVNGSLEAGTHSVDFSGTDLANGVYVYSIKAAGFIEVKKMVLLK